MPPLPKKDPMTPTINVNLKKCPHGPNTSSTHEQTCIGRPAPIPCPIPPKVEMTVRLGECNDMLSCGLHEHHAHCPARLIRVTCTIGGETWAESEIVWTDVAEQECSALRTANARGHAERLVRDLWEIVKAMVTVRPVELSTRLGPGTGTRMIYERDAVFSALAKMTTLEHEHEAARLTLPASCRPIPATGSDTPHPSADALRLYVSHLIAKVSSL